MPLKDSVQKSVAATGFHRIHRLVDAASPARKETMGWNKGHPMN